jgi:hypothetical protein
VAALPQCLHLEKMNLGGCAVFDQSVTVLAKMTWLEELVVGDDGVTVHYGIPQLKSALPRTNIAASKW